VFLGSGNNRCLSLPASPFNEDSALSITVLTLSDWASARNSEPYRYPNQHSLGLTQKCSHSAQINANAFCFIATWFQLNASNHDAQRESFQLNAISSPPCFVSAWIDMKSARFSEANFALSQRYFALTALNLALTRLNSRLSEPNMTLTRI
jgi:hypothetical protein